MSPNTLTAEQWQKLYNKLCAAFNTYSPDQSAQAALYLSVLSKFNSSVVEQAVNVAIRTYDKFPAIALLLMTINQIQTPEDPSVEEANAERQRQYKIDTQARDILDKINQLPQSEKDSIYHVAERFVPKNIREWIPMKTRRFMVDMKAILLYKERYLNIPQPFDCLADFEKSASSGDSF